MIKKTLAFALALTLCASTALAQAMPVETAQPSGWQLNRAADEVPEAAEETSVPTAAPTDAMPTLPPELSLALEQSQTQTDPSIMPQPLYVGISQTSLSIRAEMSREADSLGAYAEGERVYITGYDPEWLHVVRGTEDNWITGYVLRHQVWDIVSLQGGILPYGTTPGEYSAVIGADVQVLRSPDKNAEPLVEMKKGAKVAILEIKDGWAKVIYWRQYGYFYADAIEELTPVYDVESAQSGDLIAAFISFYSTATTGLNPNRMINIALACDYISIVMDPGDEFAFNSVAGPYRPARGYVEGMSYFEGKAVPSHGGGVCQVSSTLYNVLLPLYDGINVLYRRAHGPSGASYLPHGIDAAVGNETLDLVFRNDYDFPVRIQASSHEGVLYIAMLKA